jgi:hypothetical protein
MDMGKDIAYHYTAGSKNETEIVSATGEHGFLQLKAKFSLIRVSSL